MKPLSLLSFLTALVCTSAWGQTTQPTTEAAAADLWPHVVEEFAQALVEGNQTIVEESLHPDASICAFGSEIGEDPARLLARCVNGTVVSARAYVHPPLAMAADIAAAIKEAKLPDPVRDKMIPQDDIEMKRANATAVQWVSETLEATAGDLVGVILLHCPLEDEIRLDGTRSDSSGELVFVLVDGEAQADDAQPRIRQVVYGNPVAAVE